MLLHHVGMPVLLPEKDFAGYAMPQIESVNHYHEFVDAVMGKGKTSTGLGLLGAADGGRLAWAVVDALPQHHPRMGCEEDALR